MIESLFSALQSLLELILLLIVIFIVTAYLQRLTMETIWGDPLTPEDNSTSGENLEELTCEIEVYEDKSDKIPGKAVFDVIGSNLKSTFDKRNIEGTSDEDFKNETFDYENLSGSEDNLKKTFLGESENTATARVNLKTTENLETITSNNKNLSCNDDNLKGTIPDNENTASSNEDWNCNKDNLKSTVLDRENTASDDEDLNCDENILNSTILNQEYSVSSLKNIAVNIDKADITIDKNIANLKTAQINDDTIIDRIVDNSGEKSKSIIRVPKFMSMSENEEDSSIKLVDLSNKMSKVYGINGASFVEEDRLSRHDNDELDQYEVYQIDKMAKDEDEDLITKLDIHIQRLPQGVIINSNVFLWDAQWHTMAMIDGELFRCAVCQVYCDRLTCEDHVETIAHLRNMDKYKPLKRFDLSIVRKINVDLHCGVCNEIFDIIDYKTHENNKKHEENLLTAINKVSDLMYDSNIHFSYSTRNFHTSYRNMSNSDRNMSSSDRNMSSSDRNNGEYHFDANAINNNNISVYEEFCEEDEDVEEEEEDEVEEAEEAIEEFSYESEEYNTPFQGVSYASMVSKPTIQLPKFLKIDLGTREVRVKFEAWHMITKIGSNIFYCMVCSKKDHIRFKSQHCISCEHVEKLTKCTVVRAFEDYLIRKVDDKLYHCGHCNNLQYYNQMEEHIESTHPKKNRNFVETSNAHQIVKKTKTNKTIIESKKTESDKRAILNKNVNEETTAESKIDPSFDIFGDIPLTPFGCVLRIPALNFNLILKNDEEYYCVICDRVCVDVKCHVEELEHIELMTMTPFIKPFQNHLTRAVRGMLHCSLCNKIFPVSEVYDHNIDQPHTTALATAMGMKKSQKPKNTKRVTVLTLDNDQNNSNKPSAAPNIQSVLPFNLPKVQTTELNSKVQKENVKPASNQITDQVNINMNLIPELPNPGQNVAQKVFEAASVDKSGQKYQNTGQNLLKLLKVGLNAETKNTGEHLPQTGQNLPKIGQHLPNIGHNLPNTGQNVPHSGQNFPFTQNLNAQSIKSIPPMFNSMFPSLPPVNTQNMKNQFLGAPLSYSFNAPRPSVSPFPNISPNNTPNVISPNVPRNQTEKSQNQEIERKTIIITDKNKTAGNDNSKSGIDSRRNSDNSRSGIDNIRRNRDNSRSRIDNIRRDSDNSRSGIDNIRRNSDNSRSCIDNIRRDSDNSRSGVDKIRRDSDNSKTGSEISKSVNDNIETDSQSDEDEYKEFNEEEMVFLKLKTTYFKITNMSYNTLVFLDNGIRYCFVCSTIVPTSQLQKHVDSRKHASYLADNKFLDKYGVQLFRQMYLMYHCAICNELMTRKEIKLHLDWSLHEESYNMAHLILSKKNRKELKSGLKEYAVETQKEAIFHNVNEPNHHIRAAYQIVPNLDVKKDAQESTPAKESKSALKKNKMVIQNNVVMKIPFEHWHGVTAAKNVTKCIICQLEIRGGEVLEHVESEYHAVALGKTFEKTYYPALIRKINECTVNCMTCNLELPNNEYLIIEHTGGRKHNKHQETIVNETSNSDSYADCYEDYLNL